MRLGIISFALLASGSLALADKRIVPSDPEVIPRIVTPSWLLDGVARNLTLSPDGSMLALHSGGLVGNIYLVPTAAPDTARHLRVRGEVDTIAFAPDGKTVAVSIHKKVAFLTPANENGKENANTTPLNANPSEVILIGVPGGTELRRVETSGAILATCLTEDRILLGCADGRILTSGAKTAARERIIDAHADWIYALASIPGTQEFLSSSRDGTVKRWTIDRDEPLAELKLTQPLTTLGVSPEAITFAGSDRQGGIHLFDLKTMTVQATLPGHPRQRIHSVAYGPEKNQLISVGTDAAKIWDLQKGEVHRVVPTGDGFGPKETFRELFGGAYCPAMRRVVVSQPNVGVRAWNLGDATSKPVTLQTSRRIERSHVDPNLAWIAYVGFREVIRKDVATGKETVLHELPRDSAERITDSTLSADGQRLSFLQGKEWRAMQMPSGKPTAIPEDDVGLRWGSQARLSPDGKSVWHFFDKPNQQRDPTVLIWSDVATGDERRRFEVQSVPPAMADPWSFLDGGKRFVSARWGELLRFHEYPSGREIDRIDPGFKKPARISFVVPIGGNCLLVASNTPASNEASAPVNGFSLACWDLATKKPVWSAPFAGQGAYSRGGSRVLLARKLGKEKDADAEVTVVDAATGVKIEHWKLDRLPASATLDAKGQTVAIVVPAVEGKEKLLLADVASGKILHEFDRPVAKERTMRRLVPETGHLLLAIPDGRGTRLEVIDFKRDRVLHEVTITGDFGWQDTDLSPDGKLLAIVPRQRVVPKQPVPPVTTEIWELDPPRKLLVIKGTVRAFSPDSSKVIAREDVGEVCRDLRSGEILYQVDDYFRGFASDGRHFETYVFDNTGFTRWGLYDNQTGAAVSRITEREFFSGHHGDAFNSARRLAIAPDNGELFTVGGDAVVRTWDPQTGKQLRFHSESNTYLEAISFLPDGKHFLTAEGYGGGPTRLWDRKTGQTVHYFRGGGYRCEIGLSADGRTVFSATPTAAYFWKMPDAYVPVKR